ncbi:MAG: dodecin domain-containing protein [Thermoplasmatota archaeon]
MSGSEIIERAGVSNASFSDAVEKAINDVKDGRAVHWFQVIDQRGRIKPDGQIEFQVILRIGV